MFSHRRKLLPFYIAVALASGRAGAVGLGDLSLQSYLGKPLQAEVALSHMGDLSIDQLKVQIGSEADYSALGVEYNYVHSRLKIEPFVKNGQNYVRISTTEPISEPYLDFVLNVRWPQGQVVREFTVLLDPAPNSTAVVEREIAPATITNTVNAPEDERATAAMPTPRARAHRAASVARESGSGYITQRGDSLWRIAAKLRPSTAVSVEQMMAALLAANPNAFINGDAARLKEAMTLDVAAAERIATGGAAVPAATAVARATRSESAQAPQSTPLVEENAALKAQVTELSHNVNNLNESLAQSTDRLHEMETRLDNLLQQFQQQRAGIAALAGGVSHPAGATAAQPGAFIDQVNASELAPLPKQHTPWWVHLLYWSGIGAAAGWALREHFWPARRLALAGDGMSSTESPILEHGSEIPAVADTINWGSSEQYWQHSNDDAALTLDLADALPGSVNEEHATEIELEVPMHADEPVDASISAGVFVAFGRFDEAERLLREGLLQNRDRVDLKLQLLDVYLQSDQLEEFDRLAQSIEESAATPETLAELAVLRDSFHARG